MLEYLFSYKYKWRVVLGIVVLLVAHYLFKNSFSTVPAGYRGILLKFGAVQGVRDEGAQFVLPFVQKIVPLDVRTQKYDTEASGASKDLQIVNIKLAVNYHIVPEKVGVLYQTVGVGYADSIIHPAVQETIKAVTAKYTAEELVKNREQVKLAVDRNVSSRLASYNLRVEPQGVSLTDFNFSEEFNKAIESKQVAQQEAEQQKYVLLSAQKKAETAIATANGEAQSNRIKARALEQAGGQRVLAREWISKWNGELPKVVSGGNGGQIIDLRSLMEKPEAPAPAEAAKQ